MAASDFTLIPTWVQPLEPIFNTLITQSETMKKEYQNISATSVKKYELKFEGLSDANFKVLFDHYNARYAGYASFVWKNAYIPGYLKTLLAITTGDITGRWVFGSFKYTLRATAWDAEITLEENNS